jgi:hypothetical protein
MKNDPIAVRLASLNEHDRFVAQAQIARAEALADALAAAGRVMRRVWNAAVAPIERRARAYTAERTRYWPHAQA